MGLNPGPAQAESIQQAYISKNLHFNNQNDQQEITGKSFSEVLILASTNPHYDKRLSIELPLQYMKIPSSEHFVNINSSELWVS